MTRFTVEVQEGFNEEAFDLCMEASLPYVRQNLSWDKWGKSDEDGVRGFKEYAQRAASAPKSVTWLVRDVDNRILGYFAGKLDRKRAALFVDVILVNTDSNNSRSWIYEFFQTTLLQPILATLGVSRWYAKTYGENIDGALEKGLLAEGECPDYSKPGAHRTFKGHYGWDDANS